jgi:hypothetical protein
MITLHPRREHAGALGRRSRAVPPIVAPTLRPGDRIVPVTPETALFYYDQGHRDCERVGDHEAVLTTHEAETFSAPDCATVVGGYRGLSRCAGPPTRA